MKKLPFLFFSLVVALHAPLAVRAYSPAPSANLSSEEYGATGVTNSMISPVPQRGGSVKTAPRVVAATAAHTQKPKRSGQCNARAFDPNASTAPVPHAVIMPPRRHQMR